jgi:hypothetical protein
MFAGAAIEFENQTARWQKPVEHRQDRIPIPLRR